MNVRLQRKNLAIAQLILHFWSDQPFLFFWNRMLRHRYHPQAVWLRYQRISMMRLHEAHALGAVKKKGQ